MAWFYRFLQTGVQTFGPLGFGLILHLCISFLSPVHVTSIDLRNISPGLTIAVDRTSPIFFALEDLLEEVSPPSFPHHEEPPTIALSVNGQSDYSRWAAKILVDNQSLGEDLVSRRMDSHIALPQLVLSKANTQQLRVGEQLSSQVPLQDLVPLQVQVSQRREQAMEDKWLQDQSKANLVAEGRDHLLPYLENPDALLALREFRDEIVNPSDLTDRIKEVLRAENIQEIGSELTLAPTPPPASATLGPQVWGQSASPLSQLTPWYNENKIQASAKRAEPAQQPPLPTNAQEETSQDPELRTELTVAALTASPKARRPQIASSALGLNPMASEASQNDGDMIQGFLQFEDGLAFMGQSHRLIVYREFEGRNYEEGHVWVRDGSFEIILQEHVGQLVAELIDENGMAIGRGVRTIESRADGMSVRRMTIKLKPVTWGVAGQVISAYSFDQYIKPIAEADVAIDGLGTVAKADAQGNFKSADVAPSSSYILHIRAPDHWSTLTVSGAGSRETIKLYPNAMINALASTLQAQGLAVDFNQDSSLIWGTVAHKGHPLAGATVEISGPSTGRVIYFNELMIADSKLKATSSNGAFVVIQMERGLHSLRAHLGEMVSPLGLAPTQPGSVTGTLLNLSEKEKIIVKSFDAIDTQRPVPTTVEEVGAKSDPGTVPESGLTSISTVQGEGFVVFENQAPPPYVTTRQINSRRQNYLNIPQIDERWLQLLQQEGRINVMPQSGVAIGFVPDSDFIAYVDGIPINPENGVYFAANGSLVAEQRGQKGGGVMLYNLTPGSHIVSITNPSSNKIHLQIVVSEAGVVQTFQVSEF